MARLIFAWFLILIPLGMAAQDEGNELSEEQLKRKFQRTIENGAYFNLEEYWYHEGDPSDLFLGLSRQHMTYLDWGSTRLSRKIVQTQLELMPFDEGDIVVDIGVGNGSYEAQLMLEGVDRIQFYGLDVDSTVLTFIPPLLECIRNFIPFHNSVMQYMGEQKWDLTLVLPQDFSVVPVQNTYESTTLDTEFADKMICIRTIHHLSDEFLKDMHRTLKPRGQLCIVDRCAKKPDKSRCEDGEKGDPPVYYLTRDQIVERTEKAGFVLIGEEFPQTHSGIFVFEKVEN